MSPTNILTNKIERKSHNDSFFTLILRSFVDISVRIIFSRWSRLLLTSLLTKSNESLTMTFPPTYTEVLCRYFLHPSSAGFLFLLAMPILASHVEQYQFQYMQTKYSNSGFTLVYSLNASLHISNCSSNNICHCIFPFAVQYGGCPCFKKQ